MRKVPVHCLHAEIWPLEKFQPHPKNPNHHPGFQIEALAKVIEAGGWRQAIVVSKLSGLVIKGHGRLAAANYLGLDTAPVEFQDYADSQAELADLIADNRMSDLAEMDTLALQAALKELPIDEVYRSGFSNADFDAMMAKTVEPKISHKERKKQKGLVLRYKGHAIQMTEDEAKGLFEVYERYSEKMGTVYGFVRWVLQLETHNPQLPTNSIP